MIKKYIFRFSAIVLMISTLFCLCSCSSDSPAVSEEMFALDTVISFTVYGDKQTAQKAVDDAKSLITELENTLSTTIEQSDIYRINTANSAKVKVTDDTYSIIKRAVELSSLCNGDFDISIYPLVTLWGFDTKNYIVPDEEEIRKTISNVDYKEIKLMDNNTIQLNKGMKLDLGGIAKGYIADKVLNQLKHSGIESAIVSLGGNVAAMGTKPSSPFVIGIEYPDSSNAIFATIDNFSGAAVTSGAYQRYFNKDGKVYHHILDPNTGYPSDSDISSVTVLSDDSTMCDALSTAFFVMGVDETIEYYKKHPDFSLVILSSDHSTLYVTSDLMSDISLVSKYKEISIKEI